MLERPSILAVIDEYFGVHPAVTLSGPRQCGKTTLARAFAARTADATFFDLEDAADRQKLVEPEQTLKPLTGLVVIDEIQRQPALFETLRVLLDRPAEPARFLLLGSASPHIIRGVSESLAGRAGVVDLGGFTLDETGPDTLARLWHRGGFPRSYLAASDEDSLAWRLNAIASHVEVDLPQFGLNIAAPAMLRFWRMLAHYHGQTWTAADPARSLGVSEPTVRRYLDTLTQTLMVRQLQP